LIVWATTYSGPPIAVEELPETTLAEATEVAPAKEQQEEETRTSPAMQFIPPDICQLQKVKLDKQKASIGESVKLKIVLTPPSPDRGCHDFVTLQAPSYEISKDVEEAVEIYPEDKPWKELWILAPKTAGEQLIYVETL
jgi:hypothetical protein